MSQTPTLRVAAIYAVVLLLVLQCIWSVTNASENVENTNTQKDKILHIHFIHRHGDRTPIHPVPKSFEKFWTSLPPGALTAIGYEQGKALGRHLREKYTGILLENYYTPASVFVRSTDVERCIHTANALLSELFADPKLQATPLSPPPFPPIHIVSSPMDMLLQPTDKCASYVLAMPYALETTDASLSASSESLLNKLYETDNWTTSLFPSRLLATIADNLMCEEAHDFKSEFALFAKDILSLTKSIIFNAYAPVGPSFSVSSTKDSPLFSSSSASSLIHPSSTSILASQTRSPSNPDVDLDPRGGLGNVLLLDFLSTVLVKIRVTRELRNAKNMKPYSFIDTSDREHTSQLSVEESNDQECSEDEGTLIHCMDMIQRSHDSQHQRIHPMSLQTTSTTEDVPIEKSESEVNNPSDIRYLQENLNDWYHEKLRIYSSHDSTLIALLVSLYLMTPADDFLFPPYGSYFKLILLERELPPSANSTSGDDGVDYFVRAEIGWPIYDDVADEWIVQSKPLRMWCMTNEVVRGENKSWSKEQAKWASLGIFRADECSVLSWAKFILYTNAYNLFAELPSPTLTDLLNTALPSLELTSYPTDAGCCVVPQNFDTICPFSTSYDNIAPGCALYRRLCPKTACPEGYVVESHSYNCVRILSVDKLTTELDNTNKDSDSTILYILAIPLSIVIGMVLGLILSRFWLESWSHQYSRLNSIDIPGQAGDY